MVDFGIEKRIVSYVPGADPNLMPFDRVVLARGSTLSPVSLTALITDCAGRGCLNGAFPNQHLHHIGMIYEQ